MRPWVAISERYSAWLTRKSGGIAQTFGLEMGPPTIQGWVCRVADGVAPGKQEVGEPHAATSTGKAWACHRADIQGICL